MEMQRVNIVIAGRSYPLNVPVNEEEMLRKVGRQIESMIKDFEANLAVKDKQDGYVCFKIGSKCRNGSGKYRKKHTIF